MDKELLLECPACKGHRFIIKYEATYVYSYNIDSDAPGEKNTEEFLSYMFDKREQRDAHQFVECKECGKHFPFYLNGWDERIGIRELQKAVNHLG